MSPSPKKLVEAAKDYRARVEAKKAVNKAMATGKAATPIKQRPGESLPPLSEKAWGEHFVEGLRRATTDKKPD
jgi:hypothetical protein